MSSMHSDIWSLVFDWVQQRWRYRAVCRKWNLLHHRWVESSVEGWDWCARTYTGAPTLCPLDLVRLSTYNVPWPVVVARSNDLLRLMTTACVSHATDFLSVLAVADHEYEVDHLLVLALCVDSVECALRLAMLSTHTPSIVRYVARRRGLSPSVNRVASDVLHVEPAMLLSATHHATSAGTGHSFFRCMACVCAARGDTDILRVLHPLLVADPPAITNAAIATLGCAHTTLRYLVRTFRKRLQFTVNTPGVLSKAPADVVLLLLRKETQSAPITVCALTDSAQNPDVRVPVLLLRYRSVFVQRGDRLLLQAVFDGHPAQALVARILCLLFSLWVYSRECGCHSRSTMSVLRQSPPMARRGGSG